MLIHTGDLQPFCQLYPDLKKSITEEICGFLAQKRCSVTGTCSCILNTQKSDPTDLPTDIPKENINLQVKLFISEKITKEDIITAVDSVLKELKDISQLDQLFISTADKTDKDLLLKCWPWLEELVRSGKVKHLGLSDPKCQTIQPLIESCEIWPKSIQLFFKCENISDTCIDLLKLANYYKIRVTIHKDELTSLHDLSEALVTSAGVRCSDSWLAKYSMFDAKRKVILKKGYIVEVERCERNTTT